MRWASCNTSTEILFRGPPHQPSGLPAERELRKDRPVPLWWTGAADYSSLWQVYGDDVDIIELIKAGRHVREGQDFL